MSVQKRLGKVAIISKSTADSWFAVANIFAKSMLLRHEAIGEYNKLSPEIRNRIKARVNEFDEQRSKGIPFDATKEEKEEHYAMSVMVDSHIIAAEYNTDPVVVLMCFRAPCHLSQTIVVK